MRDVRSEHPVPDPLDLLVERGADCIEHPGGTLLDHLGRVASLLEGWGATDDVQKAGLCHACYGTDGFAPSLLGLDERGLLAARIGRRAEAWVYLYASCDREVVYPALGSRGSLWFRDGSRLTQSDRRGVPEASHPWLTGIPCTRAVTS